ncbi:hypothetical protein BH10ACI4_BH10ACI4_33810 [soil metagenome]
MERVELLLAAIAVLLLLLVIQVSGIAKRSRERFPTEKEQDYDWSQNDPAGHWEAHKNDKK